MIFSKPVKSKVWTRASSGSMAGLSLANLFRTEAKANEVCSELNKRKNGYVYTVFECKEM
jgi:hypothetical protein